MKLKYLVISALMTLQACSGSKVAEDGSNPDATLTADEASTDAVPSELDSSVAVEPAPATDKIADPVAETPAPVEAAKDESAPKMEEPAVAAAEPAPVEKSAEPVAVAPTSEENPVAEAPTALTSAPASPSEASGEWAEYHVKAGDTLMKIAYENYGDLYQWKKIFEANKDQLNHQNNLSSGMVLKIEKPSEPVVLAHSGETYLIKTGDTLGTISSDVYGVQAKWKRLWENNRQLIKDPNKIYAGFYLYYTFTAQDRLEKSSAGPAAPVGQSAPEVPTMPSSDRKVSSAPGDVNN